MEKRAMARVASCPQCDHELLVPSDAGGEAWAKCPECRAFFQVSQAKVRELPSAMLVESGDDELAADEIGLSESTEAARDEFAPSAAFSDATPELSSDEPDELMLDIDNLDETLKKEEPSETVATTKSGDELEAAAQRIDEWFRSAKTIPDTPPVEGEENVSPIDEMDDEIKLDDDAQLDDLLRSDDEPASTDEIKFDDELNLDDDFTPAPTAAARTKATIDMSADDAEEFAGMADFDLDEPLQTAKKSDEPPSWDDSERMEDMLKDIELPSSEEFIAAVSHDNDDEKEFAVEPPIARHEPPKINFDDDDAVTEITKTKERAPRRKSSLVRSLVLVVVAGLFGSAAGYYTLMWMRGPSMDFLQVAQYLPPAVLPPSFQSQPSAPVTPVTPPVAAVAENETTTAEEPQELAPAAEESAEPMPEATDVAGAAPAEGTPTDEPPTEPAQTDVAATEPANESAEVPASFNETEPAATEEPATDITAETPATTELAAEEPAEAPAADPTADVAATDPATPETQPGTELEPATEDPLFAPRTDETAEATDIKIAGTPTFSSEEFTASLSAATTAQPQLVAGNFADGVEVKQAKGKAFAAMADLAQKVLFADAQEGAASPSHAEATELFRKTLADSHTRREVAQIVPLWIASPKRKHGGVFFGGKIVGEEVTGDVVECKVELDGGKSLTVLAPASATLALDTSKPMAIVGWIVDAPQDKVQGYTGSATQAIWTKELIPLE
jgi:hypothetical protein